MATFLRHFSHVKCEGFDIPYTGTNTNIHKRHSLFFFIYPLRPSERNEQLMGVSCIQCLQVSLVVASKCGVKVMSVFKAYNLDLINLAMKRYGKLPRSIAEYQGRTSILSRYVWLIVVYVLRIESSIT